MERKKKMAKVAIFLAVTALCFVSQAQAGEKYKVGVAFPTLQEERWQNDKRFFEEEVAKMGNIEIFLQVADNDSDKQFAQIENLITQGIDVLIVGAVDTSAIAPVISRCKDDGIYVVAYCRLIQNAPLDLITLFDQYQNQQLAIQYALSKAPAGNYILLNGDQTTLPEAEKFEQAWHDNLDPFVTKGDIAIVMEQYTKNWASEVAMANTENALVRADNKIAAVICANDGIAGGAIQALEAKGLAGNTVVTGNDADITALKRIVKGIQSGTVFYNTRDQVRATLDSAVMLIEGKKIPVTGSYNNKKMDVPALELKCQFVTRDNLDAIIIDGGIRTREEVYG
jgi:D-xylose transport system substrate-binding protein